MDPMNFSRWLILYLAHMRESKHEIFYIPSLFNMHLYKVESCSD